MYQVPTSVWNQIAQQQTLRTAWGRKMFKLDQEAQEQALEQEAAVLAEQGYSNKVIVAWQLVQPMLMENEAIQQFLAERQLMELAQALPDVAEAQDALGYAVAETGMTQEQATQLLALIQRKV